MDQDRLVQPEDRLLMQKIAARDAASLRTLYDRHSPICFAICVRILRDKDEAEQVLIDVFAEVWQQAARFDPDRGSAAGYLAMMARSRAIDHARSMKQRPTRSLNAIDAEIRDKGGVQPGASSLADEHRSVVTKSLELLSAPQREAVELSFYDGLTHAEIATRLDKPVGTIKTHIRQGLIRMREALASYWKEDRSST